MPIDVNKNRTQMPWQPGPPGPICLLAKYTYIYKHFTEKAYMLRDHRRPLDEAQGGGEGGWGGGAYAPRPAYPI